MGGHAYHDTLTKSPVHEFGLPACFEQETILLTLSLYFRQ